jgi:hypothetical protein
MRLANLPCTSCSGPHSSASQVILVARLHQTHSTFDEERNLIIRSALLAIVIAAAPWMGVVAWIERRPSFLFSERVYAAIC